MQRLGCMKDDFVVERSAEKRVRMAHDSGMRGGGATNIEQGFEPSSRAFQGQRLDLRFHATHAAMFSRSTRRALF
jgi:hypothetical protein